MAEVFGRSHNIQPMLQLFCLCPSAETSINEYLALAKCKKCSFGWSLQEFFKKWHKNSSRIFQEFHKNSSKIPEEIPTRKRSNRLLEYNKNKIVNIN